MLYFAYGSNTDWEQMRGRCASAQFVAVAKLPNHRLEFTRRSIRRGCGVADAVPTSREAVWGVVYDIAEVDFGKLDKDEGYRPGRPVDQNSYNRDHRHVWRDGDEEQPLLVWVYVGNPQTDPPRPNAAYKELLVQGAKFWHLPAEYVKQLEHIKIA